MPPGHPVTRVAVLGADTVVGRAICALLEGLGYQIAPIDSRPTEVVDELLEGANLLLLAPRLEEGARGLPGCDRQGLPKRRYAGDRALHRLGGGYARGAGRKRDVAVRDEGPRRKDRGRPLGRGFRGPRGHLGQGASSKGARPPSKARGARPRDPVPRPGGSEGVKEA